MTDTTPSNAPVWELVALKYDRSVHYRVPLVLLDDDGERLWFRMQIGGTVQHLTRGFEETITKRADMIFWRRRWYNVYCNHTPAGTLDHFYCNVGLPPEITDHRIAFVDLDLDVRFSAASWWPGGFRLLDWGEFIEHARTYHYPPEVQRGARRAVFRLIGRWWRRAWPFNGRLDPAGLHTD